MTDTYSDHNRFDPTVTGNTVFVSIYNAVDNLLAEQMVKDVVRTALRQTWCIQHLKDTCTEDQSTDFAAALNALSVAEDPTDAIANQMRNLNLIPDFQEELNECFDLIRNLSRVDHLVEKRAIREIQDMIIATPYVLPGMCLSKALSNTAGMLLSVATDAHYNHQIPFHTQSPDTSNEVQLQVVTHLKLCGGQLAATETLTVDLDMDFLRLISEIRNLHTSIWSKQLRRGGLNPNLVDKGSWCYQKARDFSALNKERWHILTEQKLSKVLKKRNKVLFITHEKQLEMATAIETKIETLRKNNKLEWHTWGDGTLLTNEGDLIPPTEYLPAPSAALPPPINGCATQRPWPKDVFDAKVARSLAKNRKWRHKKRARQSEAWQRGQQVNAGPSSGAHAVEHDEEEMDGMEHNEDLEMEG